MKLEGCGFNCHPCNCVAALDKLLVCHCFTPLIRSQKELQLACDENQLAFNILNFLTKSEEGTNRSLPCDPCRLRNYLYLSAITWASGAKGSQAGYPSRPTPTFCQQVAAKLYENRYATYHAEIIKQTNIYIYIWLKVSVLAEGPTFLL